MSDSPNEPAPYESFIDVEQNSHLDYFASHHGLSRAVALDLILSCKGDRRAADEAAIAFRCHYKQSISPE
jgi:hypothetical protein